ncbi:MAG TPA: CDP-glucose 4,6-dehydratase [Steroidobacteraceae bacterium]|nr:CDP-glucose 4,6-dehydratase [Steroidobacteraceae bacterium]
MVPNPQFWRGQRVLLTGHTGFKGALLALWLRRLGAELTGFALDPPTTPSLFELAGVAQDLNDLRGDVRDFAAVKRALAVARPTLVFHLAAQALVREGYATPLATFDTNVMGTAHVLEAVRDSAATRAVVVVTSDKCYANDGSQRRYREADALGGFDPYSSSKACAELVSAAWRDSFLAARGVAVATVRAGNVIGGGDWAADRLLPDAVRAWSAGEPVRLRNPSATRPWQHALAPLAGCCALAEALLRDGPRFARAWNFGPVDGATHPVSAVIETAAAAWGAGARWEPAAGDHPHEAPVLGLDSGLAVRELGFASPWPLARAVNESIAWYRQQRSGTDVRQLTFSQIESYTHDLND